MKKAEEINILVACEESQAVCIELRKLGFNAFSCDLLPSSGGHPEWHINDDINIVLNSLGRFYTEDFKENIISKWHAIIAFPPCTFLTVTGNRWFNIERYGEKAIQRHKDREEAVEFFMSFANSYVENVAIENPVGTMSSKWREPDQIINPYQFGDAFEKKTCLWLKGFPKLTPTKLVQPPPRTQYKSGKSMPAWYAEAWKLPKEQRSIVRSKTFPGIAEAMAAQWGAYLLQTVD